MAEILEKVPFTNAEGGLIGTGFFITYGIGQLFNGVLGDKVQPKNMVFMGVFFSAIINLGMGCSNNFFQMILLWCANGFVQSMTWSPIIRIFAERFPIGYRKKACVNMASTYVIAVLLVYSVSALLVKLFSWRAVFFFSAIFLLLCSGLWWVGLNHTKKFETIEEIEEEGQPDIQTKTMSLKSKNIICLLIFIGSALIMQGILRDGLIAWVPTYITNIFCLDTSISIFVTTLLPIINLFGVYVAEFIRKKWGKNEAGASFILFLMAVICTGFLLIFNRNLVVTLISFGIVTSCMVGINTMFVSMIPTHFASYGKVSFVSGLLNSCVYIGSSFSTFGIGIMADYIGWNFIILFLCLIAVVGSICCVIAYPYWKRFLSK